jgi:hypothetical protein
MSQKRLVVLVVTLILSIDSVAPIGANNRQFTLMQNIAPVLELFEQQNLQRFALELVVA